jgi:HAD superfamily hydrolase (TIGR01509 family)
MAWRMGGLEMFRDIDAVIFDMDGTIIDSMWVWKRVDEDFLRRRSITAPEDIQKQIEGLSFTDTARFFKNKFDLVEDISDIMDEWNEMVKYYYESVIPLKDGTLELIGRLKKAHIKLGLATSNSRELTELILKRTGIYGFFDSVVTSLEVSSSKSCPDVFLDTARRLGVIPSKCLVFEDTAAGTTGARLAGMKVVAVYDEYSLPYREEIVKNADVYIYGFSEIA